MQIIRNVLLTPECLKNYFVFFFYYICSFELFSFHSFPLRSQDRMFAEPLLPLAQTDSHLG